MLNTQIDKGILLILLLMLLSLAPMPYGFYKLMKLIIFVFSSLIAFHLYNKNIKKGIFMIFIGVIFLYNPIAPIHFTKEIWIVINTITLLSFLVNRSFLNKNIKELF